MDWSALNQNMRWSYRGAGVGAVKQQVTCVTRGQHLQAGTMLLTPVGRRSGALRDLLLGIGVRFAVLEDFLGRQTLACRSPIREHLDPIL